MSAFRPPWAVRGAAGVAFRHQRRALAALALIQLRGALGMFALPDHALGHARAMALAPLVRCLARLKRASQAIKHLTRRTFPARRRHDPKVKMWAIGLHGLTFSNPTCELSIRFVWSAGAQDRSLGKAGPGVALPRRRTAAYPGVGSKL